MNELLARMGLGDQVAFDELYAMCSSRLRPYAMRIVHSYEFTEDVMQESFIAIWRDAGRFDILRGAPMTWMVTIVKNKAIDMLRSNHWRERCVSLDNCESAVAQLCDPGIDPSDAVEQGQQRHRIGFAIGGLASQQRRAIKLAFFHDLSHVEVAREMCIPLGTVKTCIRRGCIQLRIELAAEKCDFGLA